MAFKHEPTDVYLTYFVHDSRNFAGPPAVFLASWWVRSSTTSFVFNNVVASNLIFSHFLALLPSMFSFVSILIAPHQWPMAPQSRTPIFQFRVSNFEFRPLSNSGLVRGPADRIS
jgi:hypothetical protein